VAKLPGLAEIFKAVSDEPNDLYRQQILTSHEQNKSMIMMLKCFYDPTIQFDLPPGSPPYRGLPKSTDAQGRLYREMKKLYIFEKNGVANIPRYKKEQIFLQILETVDPDDAELLIGMKDKKMHYPNLTEALVRRAFPGLLPNVPFREEVKPFVEPTSNETQFVSEAKGVVGPPERRKPGPKPKVRI
jgi:hypothetical protein